MESKNKSLAWNEGYKKGLDNSNLTNPYDITNDDSKYDDWSKGYAAGYRAFINWVNLMCN